MICVKFKEAADQLASEGECGKRVRAEVTDVRMFISLDSRDRCKDCDRLVADYISAELPVSKERLAKARVRFPDLIRLCTTYFGMALLIAIPVSVALVGLVWFAGLIFGFPVNFWAGVRLCYIALVALTAAASMLLIVFFKMQLVRFARKWKLPEQIICIAAAHHKLFNKKNYRDMEREEFRQWFLSREAAEALASLLMR